MRKAIRAVQRAISTVETAKMTADELVNNEMRNHLVRLAKATSEPGDKLKKIWGDLALATGLTYSQCKRIWKREWKIIPGSVVRKLDKLVADQERLADAEFATFKARQEALNGRALGPGNGASSASPDNRPADAVG